jgi:hypothetical protein
MAAKLDPQPSLAQISSSDPNSFVFPDWFRWFYEIFTAIASSVQRVSNSLTLVGQNAAIATTTLTLPSLQNGTYRINWYIRITSPDGAGSSVQLTLGWTETAQPLTDTFPAVTGDSVATIASGSVFAQVDQNTALTYSTTYSSTTPNKMQYRLTITVESI